MEARINVSAQNINVIPGKKYRIADVARIAGCSYATARTALVSDSSKVSAKTRAKLREIADVVGCKPNPKHVDALYDGNFASREEEHNRMMYLRMEKGLSNKEIAKAIGRHYVTVLHAIGREPEEFRKAEIRAAQECRRIREQSRRRLVLSRKLVEFNKRREQVEAETKDIETRAANLEAERRRKAEETARWNENYRKEYAKILDEQKQNESKVIELAKYRKDAELAAMELGVSLDA